MKRTTAQIKKEISKIRRINRDFPSNDWCKTVIATLNWTLGKEWGDDMESARGDYP